MRTSKEPDMTPAEFEAALSAASRGVVVTDVGASDAVVSALLEVAFGSPDPSPAVVQAARAAYARQ